MPKIMMTSRTHVMMAVFCLTILLPSSVLGAADAAENIKENSREGKNIYFRVLQKEGEHHLSKILSENLEAVMKETVKRQSGKLNVWDLNAARE